MIQTYAVNFIRQKVQIFRPDSDYTSKLNIKKIFFQCLALTYEIFGTFESP